jgi:hypothetical protein
MDYNNIIKKNMKLTILSFDGKKIENDNVISVTLMTKA